MTDREETQHRPPGAGRPAVPPPGVKEGQAEYLGRHALEITRAAELIAPHVRRTPVLKTDLSQDLVLKPECFQVTGSFKPRGAFNAILSLKRDAPDLEGVIAVSSGNHAQAVALAARTAHLPAVILIPEDANPAKVEATRRLGAEVIQEGVTFANREDRLKEVMEERNLTLVHPFDDWKIIHGAATAARELLDEEPELTCIVAPVGGGGLLAGTALVAKARNPAIRVIGVEPEVADDAARTLRLGTIQRLPDSPQTIADGVRVVAIGQRNFEVFVQRRLVDAIVTVSETQIEAGLAAAWLRLKLALEPTGALPLAAHLAGRLGPYAAEGKGRTALILTGGNFAPQVVARTLSKQGGAPA